MIAIIIEMFCFDSFSNELKQMSEVLKWKVYSHAVV